MDDSKPAIKMGQRQRLGWPRRRDATEIIDSVIGDLTPEDGEECSVCGICP